MTDYSDLVKRLRGVAGQTLLLSYPAQTTPDPLSNEAADAIELLQRELKCANELWEQQKELALEYLADIEKANERIAELEAALKPFVKIANHIQSEWMDDYEDWADDYTIVINGMPTVGDLRQARKILGEKE